MSQRKSNTFQYWILKKKKYSIFMPNRVYGLLRPYLKMAAMLYYLLDLIKYGAGCCKFTAIV